MTSSWAESGFIIHAIGPENKRLLSEIATAYENMDLAIGLGGMTVFGGGGLNLVIASRMPQPSLDRLYEMDLSSKNLADAFAATGIEKTLREAGKRYFALSPRWANEEETEIHFWLNPQDQQNVNYGWFTLDNLKAWANNTGPILKSWKPEHNNTPSPAA